MGDDGKIQQYVLLAKGARGRALGELISKATGEQGLFGFGELLSMPNVQEMESNAELAPHLQLLRLFAYGTWPQYKSMAASLPALSPQQQLKLKQLTVVSLALNVKVISYQTLQSELEIPTVRELEDFLITECFYSGILEGKLDQRASCLQVHNAIGRDVRKDQLPELEAGLQSWISTAEQVLAALEQRITFTSRSAEEARAKREQVEKDAEEVKKNIKAELELRSQELMMEEGGYDYMDEDRLEPVHAPRAERVDRSERAASGRPKRRLR